MAKQPSTFLSQLKAGFQNARGEVQDGLLLAVSGGADSMALLYATVYLWPEHRDRLTVAHINHGLRGPDSDVDEALVCESAKQLGVRFELKNLRPGELAEQAGKSLEEAARNARYNWLSETAMRLEAKSVVTAHHAEDQAETILHNIIRGTGLRGLGGMQWSRPLSGDANLIRPLLNVERARIEGFLQKHEIHFRDDASNIDSRFTRNRIRNELLPFVREAFNLQFVQNLHSLSSIASETADCMDQLANRILSKALLHSDQHSCRLDVSAFAESPSVVVRQSLILIWAQLSWPRQKMSYRHWVQLAELATAEQDASMQCPGGVTAARTGTLLRLTRSSDRTHHEHREQS